MKSLSIVACTLALFVTYANAVTIAEINGNRYISPFRNQNVTNVTGLVTAKGPSGVWIRSTTPDNDTATSESVYVFGNTILPLARVGDIITLNGLVSEYRSSSSYIYLTEITKPANVVVKSSNNRVKPVVLGRRGVTPPTELYTSLDRGDIFGIPNNVSQLSVKNPVLEPLRYGLDFWESLSGELVTIERPTAASKPNQYGDTWVYGDWKVTGMNSRGGLTLSASDANPEVLIVGDPLDGSKNPTDTKLGDELATITGVITQTFGFYYILPQTAITVDKTSIPANPPATQLVSSNSCSGITVGDYNVENLAPTTAHLPKIADHIVNFLKSPDLLFLQEIQDNDGPTDDSVVIANKTLSTLVSAISALGPVDYSYVDIDPVNDQDGGEPGGNIRVAYLYNPTKLRLRNPNPGNSTQANAVLAGPELRFNPGRIAPQNIAAWTDSRKPLAAAWETLDGLNKFFTVNVHWASKGGSSSIEGDARPPVNGVVAVRQIQAAVTGNFISQILAEDPNSRIIASGDFNEFSFVRPLETFAQRSGLSDLDDVVKTPTMERYTYLFDMNCQQLDHIYVSPFLAKGRRSEYEHVHVNTWVSYDDQASDHDPSVSRFNLCSNK